MSTCDLVFPSFLFDVFDKMVFGEKRFYGD